MRDPNDLSTVDMFSTDLNQKIQDQFMLLDKLRIIAHQQNQPLESLPGYRTISQTLTQAGYLP